MAQRRTLSLEQLETRDQPSASTPELISSDISREYNDIQESLVRLLQDELSQEQEIAALRTRLDAFERDGRLQGLVGHWAGDRQGENSLGTTNAVLQGSAGFAEGVDGQAFSFGTSTASLSIEHTSSIDKERDQAFSINTWARVLQPPQDPDAAVTLFEKGNFAGNTASYGIALRPGGNVINVWLQGTTNSNRLYWSAHCDVPFSSWHEYTVTYDGSSSVQGLRVYVDGHLLQPSYTESALSTSIRSSAPATIGEGFSTERERLFAPSLLQNLSLYNRALTPENVQALAATGAASTSRLVAELQALRTALASASSSSGTAQLRTSVNAVLTSLQESDGPPTAESIATLLSRLDALERTGMLAGIKNAWMAASQGADRLGGSALQPSSTLGYAQGQNGQAFALTSSTAALTLPATALDIDRKQPFSFSTWVKVLATSEEGTVTLLEKGTMSAGGRSYGAALRTGSGSIDVWLQSNTNRNRLYYRAPIGAPLTDWHNYTISYDGSGEVSGIKVFVDGRELQATYTENTLNDNSITSTSSAGTIGDGFLIDRNYFAPALMENFAFYDRNLTLADATEMARAGIAGFSEGINTLLALRTQLAALRAAGLVAPEMAMIAPSFSVEGSGDYLTVRYQDMPEHARIIVTDYQNPNHRHKDIDIPQGAGAAMIRIARDVATRGIQVMFLDARTEMPVGPAVGLPYSSTNGFSIPSNSQGIAELAHLLPRDPALRPRAPISRSYNVGDIAIPELQSVAAKRLTELSGLGLKTAWQIGVEQHPELFAVRPEDTWQMLTDRALAATGGVWTAETNHLRNQYNDTRRDLLNRYEQSLGYAEEMNQGMISLAFRDALYARARQSNPSPWNGQMNHPHRNEVQMLNVLYSEEAIRGAVDAHFDALYDAFSNVVRDDHTEQDRRAYLQSQGLNPATVGVPDEVLAAYRQYDSNVRNRVQVALRTAIDSLFASSASLTTQDSLAGSFDKLSRTFFAQNSQIQTDANFAKDIYESVAMAPVESRAGLTSALRSISATPLATITSDLLNLYQGSSSDYQSINALGEKHYIRTDTVAGKVFMSLYQNTFAATDQNRFLMLAKAQKLLGVRSGELWGAAINRNFQHFATVMRDEFVSKGYEHIFVTTPSVPPSSELPIYLRSVQQAYINGNIDISLDRPLDGRTPLAVSVYVKGNNGNGIVYTLGNDAIATFDPLSLTISIPVDKIGKRIRSSGYAGPVKLGIALWYQQQDSNGNYQKLSANTDWLMVAWNNESSDDQNLSTLPDTLENAEQRQLEGLILKSFAENFPLDNAGNRYWLLGSGYHDGNEYNAADINSKDGGDTDRGNSVYAVANGTIRIGKYTGNVDEDIKLGAVLLDHTAVINSTEKTWQSGYLHMPLFKTGRTELVSVLINGRIEQQMREIFEVRKQSTSNNVIIETGETILLWDGKYVTAHEKFGFVGGRFGLNEDDSYNEGLDNGHLHTFVRTNGGKAIDMRKALAKAGINLVKAFDGGVDGNSETRNDNRTFEISWNNKLNVWTNEEKGLILDREDQDAQSPHVLTAEHWLAADLDTTKHYVAIDTTDNKWYQWNKSTKDFIRNSQNKRNEWVATSTSHEWRTEE